MIIEYERPERMEDAIRLLSRKGISSKPLGGGTILSKKNATGDVAVVDLQRLGLDFIEKTEDQVHVGATCTLQQLILNEAIPSELKNAADREVNLHMRNMATVGGTIISADGCSPVLTALTALDAKLTWQPGLKEVMLGEWLPLRKSSAPGLLIEKLTIAINNNLKCRFLARSPQDYPMASVAIARKQGGTIRIILGAVKEGYPVVIFDGDYAANGLDSVKKTCDSLLSGKKHGDYLKSVLPALIDQMIQDLLGSQ